MSNYSMDEDEFLDAFNSMQKERGVHIRPIYNRLWEKVEYQPIETQREIMKETFDDYEMKYEKDGFVYTEAYKEYNKDAQTLKDRKPIPEYIGEIHKKELAGKIDRSFLTHAIQDMKADQKAVIHMYLINKNIYAEDVARVIQKAHTEKLDATDMFKEFSKIANENKRTNAKELKGNGQSMGI